MNTKEQLRETFNKSSSAYERIRPGYPKALIDDIFIISNAPSNCAILEIGCATGKATEQFSSRNHSMDCIDIGQNLLDIAQNKFKHNKNIEFYRSSFEEWQTTDKKYDLIFAATSFHWIDPKFAFTKSSRILKPNGSLAVFTNKHIRKTEGFFAEVQTVYRNCLGPKINKDNVKLEKYPGKNLFHEPIIRSYPWHIEYTATEYIELLTTYSDHILLPENIQKALFLGIKKLINENYKGKIVKHYEAVLKLWKKHKRLL